MKRLLAALIAFLMLGQAAAHAPDFGDCLDGLGDLILIGVSYPDAAGTIDYGFDIVGGGWAVVSLYTNGDVRVQTYDYRDFWCLHDRFTSRVRVITKYPLAGTHFTWAVEDVYQHWHTVTDQGAVIMTPLEKDDSGTPITRLVVRQNEPADSAHYAIFDENGDIVG